MEGWMSELQSAINRLRDHVIARKPHATTLYDLGDGRNLHYDCKLVVEQAERTIAICEGYAIQQERLAEAEAAARFCWSCGCQDMWKTYREEAMKKWPWLEEEAKGCTDA
jgi:hypothetical protein